MRRKMGHGGYICLLFLQLVFVTQAIVIKDQEKIWQTWQIPYTVQAGMSKSFLNQITIALNRISRRTCLTFPARKSEPDYIHFLISSGCSSDLGRQGGRQTITIGNTCSSPTNIVHEVLHALGFMHEHQRPDRDEFIEIVLGNIQPGIVRLIQNLMVLHSL
ncbi:zinc metalloproteinase nas-6-like [Lineus longissimus]|uniref:zinc metalloproteinase nas-6-like n=1 Tax=Lineus longissimus TaxID=88925 RepID=UPI00315DE566